MGLRKRLLAVLISLTMVLTYMPVMAFAGTEPDQQGETVKEETLDADAPAETPVVETPESETLDVETPDEQEPESVTPDEQTPEEATPAETPVVETPEPVTPEKEAPEAEIPKVETLETTDIGEDVDVEDEDLKITVELEGESYKMEGPIDNDELFEEYIEDIFGLEEPEPPLLKRMTPLTGVNLAIHNKIKPEITKIANGTRTSTEFKVSVADLNLKETSWTAKDLGVSAIYKDGKITEEAKSVVKKKLNLNLKAIISTLLAECPYELYWYDKTVGTDLKGVWLTAYKVNSEWILEIEDGYDLYLAVAKDYSAGQYKVDGTKISKVNKAVENAAIIVESAMGKTDYEKLTFYKDKICELVSYNRAAADNDSTPYGDPWQIVSVFDGNKYTNVVCEGYSKAFQYLCKQTNFRRTISCVSVSGTMRASSSNEHMWNIVTMEDGNNYLVDVTNCDAGMIGAPDQLFLAGYTSKSENAGYLFSCTYGNISYIYNDNTLALYNSELVIADHKYEPPVILDSGECGENVTWALYRDGDLAIRGSGEITSHPWDEYADRIKEVDLSYGVTSIANDAFDSCAGAKFYVKKGSYAETFVKAKGFKYDLTSGHSFGSWVTIKKPTYTSTGSKKHTCTTCGRYEIVTLAMLPRTSLTKATVSNIKTKVYTGSPLLQAPVIKVGTKTLKYGTDYKLVYINNKYVGKATIKITGIGAYKDSIRRTFSICPKPTSLKSVTAVSKGFKATWYRKTIQTTGYQLRYSTSSSFASNIKTLTFDKNSIVSKKVTKLKAKKKYYVKVRRFKMVNGVRYYSSWSAVKAVTTKR